MTKKQKRKITKEIRRVAGNADGITLTREDKKILEIKTGDLVEVSKVE